MTKLKANSIDHVNMSVKNLDESVKFYQDLFGFELKKDQADRKSKIIGNDSIKLCLYEDPDMDLGNGFQHFGLHIENFNEIVAKCREMNIKMPYGVVEWENSRSVYINDPNGYEIDLSSDQGGELVISAQAGRLRQFLGLLNRQYPNKEQGFWNKRA